MSASELAIQGWAEDSFDLNGLTLPDPGAARSMGAIMYAPCILASGGGSLQSGHGCRVVFPFVMPGLVPGIHVLPCPKRAMPHPLQTNSLMVGLRRP
jgi:hypothetical protein